jgi:hypothetical protein
MPLVDCQICNKIFNLKPSHLKLGWGKYCSIVCRTKSQFNGDNVNCHICGKSIYRQNSKLLRSKSKKYFCNKSCQTKWRNTFFSKEKHPNWTSGISVYREILKNKGINLECILCNTKDVRILVAHHIDHNRNNNLNSNLSWVCYNCHHLIHTDEKVEKTFLRVINK